MKKLDSFNIAINAKKNEGLTALHLAAMKAENDRMLKYLVSKGADTKITTILKKRSMIWQVKTKCWPKDRLH
ncbi:ankyrin repeat domain-containing protein [Winogradskyella maritima]|nr:ankyrin repeat domain-containing protein [Winogradskyella maritima]